MPDIEIQNQESCVICLEIIEIPVNKNKFPCDHAKNMHTICVKKLNKCPLCRENEVSLIPLIDVKKYDGHIFFGFVLSSITIMLGFMCYWVIPAMLKFENRESINNTLVNTTNTTNI
jgi:hypothetical protein